MITVCQVVHNLTVGGAELLASSISRGLKKKHRFVFACLDNRGELADQLESEGISVYSLDRRPGADWRCIKRIWSLLRREQVDVIHAHQYAPFFYAAASGGLLHRPPLIFTEHGRTYPDYRRRRRILANRIILSKRDRVVGVGQAVRQALIDFEGFASDRVSVVYNGVDVADAANTGDIRRRMRRELHLTADDVAVMQVARLDPLKDHITALRALRQLVQHAPQVRLFIIGDGPERSVVESQVDALGLRSNVALLGTRHDVPHLWQAADIALLTSVSEGIPLTLLEAMAAAVPITATRVGGVAEVVDEGRTGLLVEKQDATALAESLYRLATDAELRRKLGTAGRQRATKHFSAARMLQDYDHLYCELGGAAC